MTADHRPRVIFVGPLPPPLHGMSAMNAHMIAALSAECDVQAIHVGPRGMVRNARYHLDKALGAVAAVAQLGMAALSGVRVYYGSSDDGLGGLWTMIFVLAARIGGMEIFLHHHSYRFLDAPTRIMALIVQVCGRSATHVVLCDEMERRFRDLYPRAARFAISANAVPEPSQASRAIDGMRPLTLGLLSNLTYAKGIGTLFEIFDRLRADGADVAIRLAGPAIEGDVAALIEARRAADPYRIFWDGPVHGDAKEAFFAGIDLFVFPSQSESFGLVLIEALMRGVSVVAPAHGCICTLRDLPGAHIIPTEQDFATAAIGIVREAAREPALSANASEAARALNAANKASQAALVRSIADRASA